MTNRKLDEETSGKIKSKEKKYSSSRQLLDFLADEEITDRRVQLRESIKALIGDPLRLPMPLRVIFFTLARAGPTDIGTIVKETNLNPKGVEQYLERLVRGGFVGEKDGKFYITNYSWQRELFPAGPYTPLIYHYNLLCDENRVTAFSKAINKKVNYGDVVVDLGAGVGILSALAARKAKKVYAIDFDFDIVETGKQIIRSLGYEDKIEYILDDAREVTLPEKVDIIICEMIDTALISELQVPVMNKALDFIQAHDKRAIPLKAISTIQLVYSDYSFHDWEFKLPHFEEYGARISPKALSKEKTYHEIFFTKKNEVYVDKKVVLRASISGKVNGVRIKTYVETYEGALTRQSSWFNPPLVLPFSTTYDLKKGEVIEIYLSYELGGGFKNLHWREVKL